MELLNIDIRPVRSLKDLLAAYNIVYTQYSNLKYVNKQSLPLHFNEYCLFPNTHTAVAKVNGQVCGTGSIVIHSDFGVPSESIFKEEFAGLLKSNRKFAEGTMFANLQNNFTPEVALSLACHGISNAIHNELNDFCVVANPLHQKFWETYMGFETISQVKECSHVESAPGILLRLDLGKSLLPRISSRVQKYEKCMSYLGCDRKLPAKDIVNLVRLKPQIWTNMIASKKTLLLGLYNNLDNLVSEALELNTFEFAA